MSRVKRLTVVLLLNLGLITALVIVGLAAHSLAVLAAGADYLADADAIGVSLLAIWLASRPPSRPPARLPQRHQHRRAGQRRLAARAEHRDHRGRDPAPGGQQHDAADQPGRVS
jgi:hypothetical protein